jgi:hypothetical protein
MNTDTTKVYKINSNYITVFQGEFINEHYLLETVIEIIKLGAKCPFIEPAFLFKIENLNLQVLIKEEYYTPERVYYQDLTKYLYLNAFVDYTSDGYAIVREVNLNGINLKVPEWASKYVLNYNLGKN